MEKSAPRKAVLVMNKACKFCDLNKLYHCPVLTKTKYTKYERVKSCLGPIEEKLTFVVDRATNVAPIR